VREIYSDDRTNSSLNWITSRHANYRFISWAPLMQALVYTAPLRLELQDVPDPQPRMGEVVVEVAAVGICGSELEGFRSQSPFRVPPLIMGHEFVGRRLDDGARVAINPLISCGRCDQCLPGARNLCRERQLLGVHRPGGFAERVAVPESCCIPLRDDVTFERAVLAEPMANALHAWRLALAQDQAPSRVGIVGAGMLGLATALVALDAGVRHVMIADLSPERLASATAVGVPDVADVLAGEFDVIFDAVGSSTTRAASVASLRPGGTTVWIGLGSADPGFDALGLVRGEQRVLGTFAYLERDFSTALELVSALEAAPWVATRPLSDGVETFLDLVRGPSAVATKMLLRPAHTA
jgi:2-desacetyl-2-hydroxyethyl bacteriochlorophyllide A dehydrogenase